MVYLHTMKRLDNLNWVLWIETGNDVIGYFFTAVNIFWKMNSNGKLVTWKLETGGKEQSIGAYQ